LKKQLHSCRVRIRNNLLAQYFPELDRFWNNAEAENLAIVRWLALAAIGNPHRFENRAQLIRLAGFDLSANRSGEKSRTAVPVISKKGKADLRYALYQAALVASSLTSHFRAYYSRLLDGRQREKGIRTKMLVKIAAKMLVIAWTLMKRKEPFNPAHIQA